MNKIRFCLCSVVLALWPSLADAQIKDFTPAEMQSISVPTPGLFDNSPTLTIDFTDMVQGTYSFPLPVGKAELAPNKGSLVIETKKGDAVKAMFDGVVRLSKNNPPYGNVIVVRHDNGLETVYSYNAQNLVKVGDKVKAGQTIAIVGGEGIRTFCDFGIMINGRRVNPSTIVEVQSHRLRKQKVTFTKDGPRISIKTVREPWSPMSKPDVDAFAKSKTIKWNLQETPNGMWSYPLRGSHVISPYNHQRAGYKHTGVDLKTKPNDNIRAAFDGIVIMSGPATGYGNCIKVKHGNGLMTLYGHQSKNLVKTGERVKAGQVIGLEGRTGRATTEHLHFEVFFCDRRYNPEILFNHDTQQLQNVTLTIDKNGNVTSKKNVSPTPKINSTPTSKKNGKVTPKKK